MSLIDEWCFAAPDGMNGASRRLLATIDGTTRKRMRTALQDHDNMVKAYEDAGTIDERIAEQKKLSAILKVSTAFRKHRSSPEEFLKALEEQQQFLNQCPIVSLALPAA
eukprot:4769129-Karenia_brevis.AAC.1